MVELGRASAKSDPCLIGSKAQMCHWQHSGGLPDVDDIFSPLAFMRRERSGERKIKVSRSMYQRLQQNERSGVL